MKLKCPACSNLLEVPESARGKVAKCKCGKQIRIPAASGSRSAAAAPRSAASESVVDDSLFDELTESDLKTAIPRGQQEEAEPEEENVDEAAPKRSVPWLIILAAIVVLAIIGGLVWYLFFFE